jgi:hypothetical protein
MTPDGKVNMMGVFDVVNAPSLPFVLPVMYLVVAFSASPAEVGSTKALKAILMDADAKHMLEIDGSLPVPSPPVAGTKTNVASVVGLMNVAFAKAGQYQFSILVNGEEKTTLPLTVNERPGGN